MNMSLTKQEWFQLRIRACMNWLDMLAKDTEGNCVNTPKLKWSPKCDKCPHYLCLEDEDTRESVCFCMAEIAKRGNAQLNKFRDDLKGDGK